MNRVVAKLQRNRVRDDITAPRTPADSLAQRAQAIADRNQSTHI